MATRSNRFFNDPAFAQIASNLSGLFAPPSAGDTLAYEKAAAERAQQARITELWNAANGDTDRMGVIADLYDPTQSYYAVDQANATTRRGQDIDSRDTRYATDVGAQTTLATNAADNARQVRTNMDDNRATFVNDRFNTPLAPGETMPNTMGEESALIENVFGFDPGMAELGSRTGLPETPTRTQVEGNILQGMDPAMQQAIVGSDLDLVEIINGDGQPVYETEMGAIGQPAYVNSGGQAGRDLVQWYDPATDTYGTAEYDPNGGGLTPLNGSPPPPPSARIVKPGEPVGTNADLGLGAPANNVIDQSILQIDQVTGTLDKLAQMIADNPASQGLVGDFRGFMQNAQQTGNELGQYFGGRVEEVNRQLQNGGAYPEVAQSFDPSLPAIEVMSNILAFQYAKTLNDDRLSNEMLRQARQALGLERVMANQGDSLERLRTVRETLQAERAGLLLKKQGGLNAGQPGAGPTQTQQAPAPAGSQPGTAPRRMRYNLETNEMEPVQ